MGYMLHDEKKDVKFQFTEYDNVYIAHQIQTMTFGVLFAMFAIFMRYTLYNISKPEASKPAKEEANEAEQKSEAAEPGRVPIRVISLQGLIDAVFENKYIKPVADTIVAKIQVLPQYLFIPNIFHCLTCLWFLCAVKVFFNLRW